MAAYDDWRPGRVVPLGGPLMVANTHPELWPRLTWGGERDGWLVLSDAPEVLDDTNIDAGAATLYSDLSGAVAGRVRVLLFHVNRTRGPRRLGVTVRNLGEGGGRLSYPADQAACVDLNGTLAGHTAVRAWFSRRASPLRTEVLAAGAAYVLLDREVAPGYTLAAVVECSFVDQLGSAGRLAVQTWVAPAGVRRTTPEMTWDAPLAPWRTASNASSKIRATVPHSDAMVTVRVPAGQDLMVDLCAVSPSGGPGASPGDGPPTPAGFPLAGPTAPWLAPGHALARTAWPWPYQADPAGFDGTAPASEYVPGWDDADQRAEGVKDPPAHPAFWYRSQRYGAWMRQWNYGNYGCALDVRVQAEEGGIALAANPARERFSSPLAWYDPGRGVAGAVPWDVVRRGALGTRYGGESTAFVMVRAGGEARLVTTLTPGAYAPYRLVAVSLPRP
ncbi:MAG: hypothetical protein K6V73_07245 [Firmicutes bacterium]|nr:hypothetical protein [Bacillota bacterium]